MRLVLNLVFKGFLQTSIPPLISIFYAKEEGGGVSRYSFENFLSHSTKKIHRRTLLCFRKLMRSKNFIHKRGYHDFLSKFFCLKVPKNFVEKPFGVSENFGYGKILCIRRGYHDFLSKFFCLKVPKNFVGEPFSASENFGYRKILCKGAYPNFPS